jgi:putative tryptophan/tyrosine transport system substrate-binding protein
VPRVSQQIRSRSGLALAAAVLATLATLGTACAGSGEDDAGAEAVRTVGLMHVGIDHVPSSFESLTAELEKLGWELPDLEVSRCLEEKRKSCDLVGENVELIWKNLEDEKAAEVQADVLVRQGVDVLVAFEDQSIRAAQLATAETQTPIVFLHPNDPVRSKLVESLPDPGTNLTGVFGARDLVAKHLEFYTAIVPGLERVLALVNPSDPGTEFLLEETQATAKRLGVELLIRETSDAADIQRVFRSLQPGDVEAVVLLSPTLRLNHTALTIRLARRARLPVQAHRKEWVEQGALFSYGMDLKPLGTLGATYVDDILDGMAPSELSVQELPETQFALNLATARRLGIKVPQKMIIRADLVYR